MIPRSFTFRLGMSPARTASSTAVSNRRLHRPHQDVRVLAALDRHLAHHQRRRPHLHVAIQDREDLGMPLHLVADQVGDGIADWAVQFANHHLRLRSRPGRLGLDQRLARAEHNPLVLELRLLVFPLFLRHGVILCRERLPWRSADAGKLH